MIIVEVTNISRSGGGEVVSAVLLFVVVDAVNTAGGGRSRPPPHLPPPGDAGMRQRWVGAAGAGRSTQKPPSST